MTDKQQLILSLKNLKANFVKHNLQFKNAAKTSRNVLTEKEVWFLKVYDEKEPNIKGIGEVAPIFGLSVEKNADEIEKKLVEICNDINNFNQYLKLESLTKYPSVKFALEVALLDLSNRASKIIFKNNFTQKNQPIAINGLIWMSDFENMISQIDQKIKENFDTIKLKIGSLDFEEELKILDYIKNNFSDKIIIRVDANGAFEYEEAKEKLEMLSKYKIHSIEQPIKAGNWQQMAKLCKTSKVKIALDEELIGIDESEKENLITTIKPQFLILKPSLIGGFKACESYINLAKKHNINYWVTSALESNIGLNAIAQWTFNLNIKIAQGLGTGQLFTNNIFSPLKIYNGKLQFSKIGFWNLTQIVNKQEVLG